jgi:hypothetical protein
MARTIGAVAAGAAVWAVLWITGNMGLAAALPDIIVQGQPVDHVPALAILIGYSVVLSALAGFTTAAVKGREPMGAVKALAALQLLLGVGFEVSAWALLPVWYHVVFLALLVPATLWGGTLKAGSRPAVV